MREIKVICHCSPREREREIFELLEKGFKIISSVYSGHSFVEYVFMKEEQSHPAIALPRLKEIIEGMMIILGEDGSLEDCETNRVLEDLISRIEEEGK